MSITRPVVILLAVGAVLGLFALGKKHPAAPGAQPAKAPAAAASRAGGDARAALERFAALINQRDAAGLEAILHRPFYADGRKLEDDRER